MLNIKRSKYKLLKVYNSDTQTQIYWVQKVTKWFWGLFSTYDIVPSEITDRGEYLPFFKQEEAESLVYFLNGKPQPVFFKENKTGVSEFNLHSKGFLSSHPMRE